MSDNSEYTPTPILVERLSKPDLVGLPDWQVANILNSPDKSMPVIVEWIPTKIGVGLVLTALGVDKGALLLSQIENLASTQPVMKWGLEVLRNGDFDLSLNITRQTVENLVNVGLITSEQRDQFYSISRRERNPSWSEYMNIFVDARIVGLARGAKP